MGLQPLKPNCRLRPVACNYGRKVKIDITIHFIESYRAHVILSSSAVFEGLGCETTTSKTLVIVG